MNVNLRARAKTNHVAANDYELEFREGDIITILTVDGDAATAELRGMRGVLNLNLVDILQDAPSGPKGIPVAGSDDVRISIPASGYRGQPGAGNDIMHSWDDEPISPPLSATTAGATAAAAAAVMNDTQMSSSSQQFAQHSQHSSSGALPPMSPGGAGGAGTVPTVELSQQDMVLISYADHVFKGDSLLLGIRRHFFWVAAAEAFLLFFFLIFYFATSWTVSAHDIWFHIAHILRQPVIWYLVYKLGSIATLEQLKLVLDSSTEEHKQFFNQNKLVVTMAGVFAVLTLLAVLLDFIAIWVRVGELPLCYLPPVIATLINTCTMSAVLLVFTVIMQVISLSTLVWAPTVKWGVPAELWQVLSLHVQQYLPSFLTASGGPTSNSNAAAPAATTQQVPVTPEGAPIGDAPHTSTAVTV